MRWLGIDDNHHELSHLPDSDATAQDKLTRINKWFCEQLAYLAKRLAETPEPRGNGSLLDNTLVVWTNKRLGKKGNSHPQDDIPFVVDGLDFRMGQSVRHHKRLPHNRLLLAAAHGMGHRLERFNNPDFCRQGVLPNLT